MYESLTILFLCLCGLVISLKIVYRISGGRYLIISPVVIFVTLYVIFYYFGTLILFFDLYKGSFPFYDFISGTGYPVEVTLAMLLFVLGAWLVSIILKFNPKHEVWRFKNEYIQKKTNQIFLTGSIYLVVVFSIAITVYDFIQMGLLGPKKIEYYSLSHALGFRLGFLKNVLPAFVLLLIVGGYQQLILHKKMKRLLVGIFMGFVTVYLMIMHGARIFLMDFVLWGIVVTSFFMCRFKFYRILVLSGTMLFLFFLISFMRYQGDNAFLVLYEVLTHRIFLAESSILNFIFMTFPDVHNFFSGAGFGHIEDLGMNLSCWLYEESRGAVGISSGFVTSNVPVSFVGEMYMNFSYFAFFFIFMYGALLQMVFIVCVRTKHLMPTDLVFVSIIFAWLGRSVEVGVVPVAHKMAYFSIMLIGIHLVGKIRISFSVNATVKPFPNSLDKVFGKN